MQTVILLTSSVNLILSGSVGEQSDEMVANDLANWAVDFSVSHAALGLLLTLLC